MRFNYCVHTQMISVKGDTLLELILVEVFNIPDDLLTHACS